MLRDNLSPLSPLFFFFPIILDKATWPEAKRSCFNATGQLWHSLLVFFFYPHLVQLFEVDRIIACTGECSSINEISFASMHKDSHCPMQSLSLCTRVAFVKKSNWIIRCHQDLFLPATTLSRRAISSNEDRCWLRFLSQLVYNLCFKISLFCYLNKITVNIAFHCLKPESTVGFVFS